MKIEGWKDVRCTSAKSLPPQREDSRPEGGKRIYSPAAALNPFIETNLLPPFTVVYQRM